MSTAAIAGVPTWFPLEGTELSHASLPWAGLSRFASSGTFLTAEKEALLNAVETLWKADVRGSSIERANHVVEEALLTGLALIFEIEDDVSLSVYLRRYPFLINLLLEAFPKLEAYFGLGTAITLRLVEEPDASSEVELFAMVQTTLHPEDALRRLESFDQEWWLDASPRANCKLNFSVEYL